MMKQYQNSHKIGIDWQYQSKLDLMVTFHMWKNCTIMILCILIMSKFTCINIA